MNLPGREEFAYCLEHLSLYSREPPLKAADFEKRGGVILLRLNWSDDLVIVGDIHGDYTTFNTIVERSLQTLEGGGYMFLLGDYIDRGTPEGQVLTIYRLCRLTKEYPGRVVMLRGNHEPPEGLEPMPHDYPLALQTVYGSDGRRLYSLSRKLFDSLPHAILVEGALLMLHGGPPTINLETASRDPALYLGSDGDPEVIAEILWNDPAELDIIRAPNPRGVGSLWGPRVTAHVARSLKIKRIVRGHEPAMRGYKLNHGGAVVTLFSRLGAPYFNSQAAFVNCKLESIVTDDIEEFLNECIATVRPEHGEHTEFVAW
ncbi:serine/threonine protein phosphatase [Aeropyrum pernix]|uniref:Serine/threonine protein phosphatase n=1 Tax=Aeropyrum pernix TaxID=56636 RepID=A0A401HA89_AERPX|nr:metallophosphoesterase family protein [Aeropyrum pernix]GBF09278.1 serine/threonine protein phosphatase [Aeropyrum pernix]